MPSIPGLSFSPLTPQGNGQGDGNATPIQQAVRTLSYKVPRTVGAASPIPSQLLNSQGSAGVQAPMGGQMPSNVGPSMGSAPTPDFGFEEILRRLFGMQIPAQEAQGGPSMSGPSMGGSAPAPNYTPGIEPTPVEERKPLLPPPAPPSATDTPDTDMTPNNLSNVQFGQRPQPAAPSPADIQARLRGALSWK